MAHLQLAILTLLISLIFIFSGSIKLVNSQLQFTYTNCSITPDTYTPNSAFQLNLEKVLSNLTFATTTSDSTFANSSFGQGNDIVYGLYLCRGDLPKQDCSSCINNVTKSIVEECPNKKESIKWVQECMVRYANRNIFSKEEETPSYIWRITPAVNPPKNVTLPPVVVVFNLTKAIYELINETAFSDYTSKTNKRYFSTREDNVTGSWYPQTFYSLAQCTPDISQLMCQKCLTQAYSGLRGSAESLAYFPSCHIRYDLRKFYRDGNEKDVIPTPQSPTRVPPPSGSGGNKEIAIGVSSTVAILLLFTACFFIWRWKFKPVSNGDNITMESLQYDINTIKAAVNDFSESNKLGRGGFGDVYKGRLENGQEIAVKRLSPNSNPKQGPHEFKKLSPNAKQGLNEFKTEVLLLAKLQHKNLVRLLGFCAAEKEKLLIYEYLPCSSLDRFLFNPEKRASLEWETRYNIIDGVAKGLLYLHEDSRYKIIHRDLKPGNILLDIDMTPKISDFGLAKLFGEDKVQNISKRIVGTQGYMAPEYVSSGNLLLKSDVYSFGVFVLEMVSGRRIREHLSSVDDETLLECAWRLWNENEPLALVDSILNAKFTPEEARRCIHIGLSCVHIEADKRPSMASVVSVLNSYSSNNLPQLPPEGYYKQDDKLPSLGQEQSTGTYSGVADITTLSAR